VSISGNADDSAAEDSSVEKRPQVIAFEAWPGYGIRANHRADLSRGHELQQKRKGIWIYSTNHGNEVCLNELTRSNFDSPANKLVFVHF
jgi:hypothetical protein